MAPAPSAMPTVPIPCNLCGADAARLVATANSFRIVRCTRCSLVYVNPQPVVPTRAGPGYYDRISAAERPSFAGSREAVYRQGLDRLESLVPARGRILDVGCGFGHFLNEARERGWRPVGIDPSEVAVSFAVDQLGLPDVRTADLREAAFGDGELAAVTMWNVLEHVPDPAATLAEAARVLRPGGVVLVRVPNMVLHEAIRRAQPASTVLFRAAGRRVPPFLGGISPPRHLFGFTPTTMRRLLERSGFHTSTIDAAVPHGSPTTLGRLSFAMARAASRIGGGRAVLSPAFIAYGVV